MGVSSFTPLEWENITLRQGRKIDTLFVHDFLTVINKSAKSFWYAFKGEPKYATSFLASKTGKILLSHSGIIQNPKEVIEMGYWADQRVADLLPLDYASVVEQPDTSQLLIDRLHDYVKESSQEEVFVHLNKSYYALGEKIWLKSYLMDASTHIPYTNSKVLYVELINPEGKIVDSLLFHTQKGTWGHFLLKRQYLPGTYQIRAYTSHMRNFGPGSFFQHAFSVFSGPNEIQRKQRMDEKKLENLSSYANPSQDHVHIDVKSAGDSLDIEIKNTEESDEDLFLLGHVRGKVCVFGKEINSETIYHIAKDAIPSGTLVLSLFTESGTLLTEYPFQHLGKSPPTPFQLTHKLGPKGLELELVQNLETIDSVGGSYSLSILDHSLVPPKNRQPNLQNYLFEQRGQNRYSWDKVLENKRDFPFRQEQGYSLSGFVSEAGDSLKRTSASVMINSLSKDFYVNQTETDKEGNFVFEDLPYLDSTLYILQGRAGAFSSDQEKVKLQGNRNVDIFLKPTERPEVSLLESLPVWIEDTASWSSFWKQKEDEYKEAEKEIVLDEVEITGRRQQIDPRAFNVFDLDMLDWVPPQTSAQQMLSMFKAGLTYEVDRSINKMVLVKFFRGEYVKFPVTFYIDNMLSSYLAFQALRADIINYIGFSGSPLGTAIFVRTRVNGPRSRERELEHGILHYVHPGYDLAEDFPQTSFDEDAKAIATQSTQSVEATLFWEPNLSFQEGTTSCFIPKDKLPASIFIQLEGVTEKGIPLSQSFVLSNLDK